MKNKNKVLKIMLIVFAVFIGLILISNMIKPIPTGYVGIKTRFSSALDKTLEEGINFKLPIIEDIVLIDCKTQKIEGNTESASKDLQTVMIDIAVNYNVNKEEAIKLYKQVGVNYSKIIVEPAILESIKSATAQYTAEELITLRSEVSNKIQQTLAEKIGKNGFTVTSFNITNLEFSAEYNLAIEEKQVSEQRVKTAQYKLEQTKIENEQKISVAQTEAEVMKLQNTQITENTLALKKLEIMKEMVEKWNGMFPETMLNENISGLFKLD